MAVIRKPTSGNRTDRRGSRYIQNPHLDKETAKSIKILLLARGTAYTPEAVAAWIAEQAQREWEVYDAEVSIEADAEGGVFLAGPARGLELNDGALAELDVLVERAGPAPHTRETLVEQLIGAAWRARRRE